MVITCYFFVFNLHKDTWEQASFFHVKLSPIGGAKYFQIQSGLVPFVPQANSACLIFLADLPQSLFLMICGSQQINLISPYSSFTALTFRRSCRLVFGFSPCSACSQPAVRQRSWERGSHARGFGCAPEELTLVFVRSSLILAVLFHSFWKRGSKLLQNKYIIFTQTHLWCTFLKYCFWKWKGKCKERERSYKYKAKSFKWYRITGDFSLLSKRGRSLSSLIQNSDQ